MTAISSRRPAWSWTCHACNDERPDPKIAVRTVDTSDHYDLPFGSVKMNFRYCVDRPACLAEARRFKGWGVKGNGGGNGEM